MGNKPKVAIVAASAPPYSAGGVASAHFNLFKAMRQAGLDARLFTFLDGEHLSEEEHIVRNGVSKRLGELLFQIGRLPFRLLAPHRGAYQTADIFQSMPGARRMVRAVDAFAPHAVVLSDHGAPGLFLKRTPGRRMLLVSHHNPARFINQPHLARFSELDARVALKLEQRVVAKVDQVICPSNYMRAWFQKTYSFDGPINVVPNLIDAETIEMIAENDPRPEMNLSPNAPLIYLPSAGTTIKGAAFLSDLVRGILKDYHERVGFYIPGPMLGAMRQKLEEFGDRAVFLLPGPLGYAENIARVKTCTFGISPAPMENFSMAILEAAFCGVPMLAFRSGGNADIISDGENGYLVDAFETLALVQKATELLGRRDLKTLQARCRDFTRQHFRADTVIESYCAALGVPWPSSQVAA